MVASVTVYSRDMSGIRYSIAVLSCALLTACTGSDAPSGSATTSAADWSKVGETDAYAYYADHGSVRKADETVTMSDLLDYKTPQIEGGAAPALSKITSREYDCQNQKSQPLKTTWYSGQMGTGSVVHTTGGSNSMAAVSPGTATAGFMRIACGL